VHCLRPASTHVKQLLACALREVSDRVFGYAILEVSIHATEDELLALLMAGLFESIVSETTVVAVVVLNFYAMLSGEGLKGMLGGNGLNQLVVDLEVDEA
jgi:hypothetical protein